MINHLFTHSFSSKKLDGRTVKIKIIDREAFANSVKDYCIKNRIKQDEFMSSFIKIIKKVAGRGIKQIWFDQETELLNFKYGKHAKHRSRKTN